MGIYGHRFYFEKGLPKIQAVKEQFFEITGLKLRYYSIAYPQELITEQEELLEHLSSANCILMNSPRFACEEFDDVYLGDYMQPDTKSFYLEFGVGSENMYIFFALIKTMLELGGRTFRYSYYPHEADLEIEKYLEPYNPHEREWKRIKKWTEMSDFEKKDFKCRHAKK